MWKKTITPRFGDVDGLRHINNCNLPLWFEIGREPTYRLFHPDLDLANWKLIMAKISVEFTAQMRLGADVDIHTYIKKVGRSSFTIFQEAWQEGVMGAKGDSVIVHYDFEALKSLPIPDDIRAELESHLVPEDHPSLRSHSGRLPVAGR